LVPNDDANSLLGLAAAMDMNQLVRVQAIAVEHRVAEGFAKREFDVLLLSADAVGFRD
jgi:flagellar biosynthesis/type III secretory pathway ATPase